MSAYSDFYDEAFKITRSKKIDLEEAELIVRDKWIDKKKYSSLIAFILDNWISRNCVNFMTLLTNQLAKENKLKLYKRIWKPVIRYNAENFWVYNIHNLKIDYPNITWNELKAIDTSHIKPYGDQTDNEKENAAFWGKYYLNALELCKDGLSLMGDIEEVKNFEIEIQNIHNLKQQPQKRKKNKIVLDKRKIDEPIFWELIGNSRKIAETKEDFLELLKSKLIQFKPLELKRFQKILLTYQNQLNHWDTWALAYIVRRGCGDDCFDYFKLWVISKGKDTYEAIKNNEVSQFKDIFTQEDPEFEDFEYLAEEVYEELTNKEMKQPNVKRVKMKGKQWNEDKVCENYATICELFNFK